MKGLFIKDFKLIMGQTKFILMLFVAAIWLMFMMEDASFVIGYLTFVFCIVLINTISYDEFDNGYAFLFTLPFSRKDYAVEKYIFGIVMSFGVWLLAVLLSMIGSYAKGVDLSIAETVLAGVIIFAVAVLILSVMLPIELKFGSEKSRIVLCAGMAAFGVIIYFGKSFSDYMNIKWAEVFNRIETLGTGILAAIAAVIILIFISVSLLISIRIVENKEL